MGNPQIAKIVDLSKKCRYKSNIVGYHDSKKPPRIPDIDALELLEGKTRGAAEI